MGFTAGSLIAADAPTTNRVTVVADLRDGSKLIGYPVPPEITVELKTEAVGQVRIPLHRIERMEFSKDGTATTVVLRNGDKLKGDLQLRALKLQTLLGPLTVPMTAIVKFQVRAPDTGDGQILGAADWQALPFPDNCDWPGDRGSRSRIDDEGLHLLGQPVRTVHSYKLPLDVDCEFVLLEPLPSDGNNLQIIIGQPGAPPEVLPENMLQLCINSSVGREKRMPSKLLALQHAGDPHCRSPRVIAERDGWELLAVGEPNRLKIHVGLESCQVMLNDKTFTIDNWKPESAEVLIEFWHWKPSSRWLVRNVSIRPAAPSR